MDRRYNFNHRVEHHANLIPWQIVARKPGASLRYLPVEGDAGRVDRSALDNDCRRIESTVVFTHISNSLGCINPVKENCSVARRNGVVTLVDAAQSAGHTPIDVRELPRSGPHGEHQNLEVHHATLGKRTAIDRHAGSALARQWRKENERNPVLADAAGRGACRRSDVTINKFNDLTIHSHA